MRLKVGIIGECPLGHVRFLGSQMMQWVSLAPLVDLVVLINIASLRTRDPIVGRNSRASQSRQRTEHSAFFLRHLRPFHLIHHPVALLNGILRQLLRRVLAPKRLQLSIRHIRINIDRPFIPPRRRGHATSAASILLARHQEISQGAGHKRGGRVGGLRLDLLHDGCGGLEDDLDDDDCLQEAHLFAHGVRVDDGDLAWAAARGFGHGIGEYFVEIGRKRTVYVVLEPLKQHFGFRVRQSGARVPECASGYPSRFPEPCRLGQRPPSAVRARQACLPAKWVLLPTF
eukprot:GEMP01051709.1.p1 GENE.GEMP01051709.1~~GEMP01051709.1.p1  ORF type:complete len:286 (-),score=55.06 GEMP01051709.1:259-1116(-)